MLTNGRNAPWVFFHHQGQHICVDKKRFTCTRLMVLSPYSSSQSSQCFTWATIVTCDHQGIMYLPTSANLSNCRLLRLNKVLAVFLQTSLSLIVTYCLCQYLDEIFQKYRFYLPCFVEIVLTRKYTSISLWKANCYRCFLIVGLKSCCIIM